MISNLLTIAIPTYNRHEFLLEQLKRLVPQTSRLDEIDVLIIDNNSDISVAEFLNEKISLPPNYKIIRNPLNIGIDANILECLKNTKTTWIWTLSDGDFIKGNAVKKVYNFIEGNQDAVFINLAGKNLKSKGFQEFCEKFIYWGIFSVSHTIFNINELKYLIPFYEKYVKTHNGQLFLLLKYLEKNDNGICIFNDLNVHESAPLPGWSKAAFVKDTINTLIFLNDEFISQKEIIKTNVNYKIVNQCLGHLCNAKTYEGLSLLNYIRLFNGLLPFFSLRNFLGPRMFLFIITVFNNRIYRWARRKSGKREYEFSNASKSLKWDY